MNLSSKIQSDNNVDIVTKIIDELVENIFKHDVSEYSQHQQYGNFDYVEI